MPAPGEAMYCRLCNNPNLSKYFLIEKAPAAIQKLPINALSSQQCITDIQVYSCEYCGLIQLDNSKIVKYHTEVIRSFGLSSMMHDYRTKRFTELFSNLSEKVDYVEFGAGAGECLPDRKHFSLGRLAAFEDGKNNRNQLVNFKLDNIFSTNDLDSGIGARFNRFGCFNYLEHLIEPKKYLQQIRPCLTSGAIGLIEVPNFEAMHDLGVFNDFSLEHLSYFTRRSIRNLFNVTGFEILSMSDELGGHTLSCMVRNSTENYTLKTGIFYEREMALKRSFRQIFRTFGERTIGLWGVGHQSITMILALGLEEKLEFVVDSSVSKQGRFVPGTGLCIEKPTTLKHYDDPFLLINTSAYNNEVEHTVVSDYPNIKNWVIIDNSTLTIKERGIA